MLRRWAVWGTAAASFVSGTAWGQGAAPASEGAAGSSAESQPEAAAPPRGPHTARTIQLGLGFRYGAELNQGDFNPWGPGLGLSVGCTFPNAIYLGGNLEYFFGDDHRGRGDFEIKGNIWQLTAEGGYDVGAGDNFVIRPKLGFGIARSRIRTEGCLEPGLSCEDGSNPQTEPVLAPGATLMIFTKALALAFDARYARVFTDNTTKSALIFSFGIGF